MQNCIPLILFTYNRTEPLKLVLEAIKHQTKMPERMIVFSDANRSDSDTGVHQVRNILNQIDWIETEIVNRPINFGCARNIIHGITEVLSRYNSAVIIEDDVLPAKRFYEAMLLLLQRYLNEEKVFAVGGYPTISNTIKSYDYDVIMSPRFSCWGWGTWANRWEKIIDDLMAKRLPYKSQADVPIHAGSDIKKSFSAVLNRPDFYWDYPISLHCLKNQWMQAITNYYLINNIGLTSGDHGNASTDDLKFFKENNMVQDKLPSSFPEPIPNILVDSSIREYLDLNKNNHSTQNKKFCVSLLNLINQLKMKIITKTKMILRRITNYVKFVITPSPKPNPKDYSTVYGIGSVVPCQIEAYFLALNKYLDNNETVLDVGFGLGYGLNILAIKARSVSGVDIDPKVLEHCYNTIKGRNPKLKQLELFDGYHLPFPDNHFDLVTSVDVLEHVVDYHKFIDELLRVSRKGVFISTPNRRPEYTNPDGTPKNFWHLREWSFEELEEILKVHGQVDWNFLNGPWEGPFKLSSQPSDSTLTLSPFLSKE